MAPPRSNVGKVFLVGAGPGDPDLLTLRAAKVLRAAEVIVFDRLVAPEIVDLAPAGAERIFAGKMRGRHVMQQEAINELLVARAREGLSVVRLKGGDPLVFGRGGEELEALAAAGIPFEVVPGITAATGCAAATGIPLTHRDHARSVTMVTGHTRDGTPDLDWPALARPGQTIVVYMGLHTLAEICAGCVAHGLDPATPAGIVENGTLSHQRVIAGTLDTLPGLTRDVGISGPALIVIGHVVGLWPKLAPSADPESAQPGAASDSLART